MNATITNPVNLLLMIVGTYLGFKLAVYLIINKFGESDENSYLGWLVFIQTLPVLVGCVYRFELLEYLPHFIGIQTLFHFLVGPLAYFYVRACTQKDFRVQGLLWLHFLPFGIDVLRNIPFFLLSGTEKLAFYEEFIQFGKLYSPPIWNVVKTIHGLTYFGISFYLIQQYRKHLPNAASSIDTGYHRWLLFFIFVLAFPILVSIYYVSTDYSRAYTILVWLVGVVFFFVSIDIAILRKPELFRAFPHQMPVPDSSEDKKRKYEQSNLQEKQKEQYIEKLQNYVQEHQPYLQPELSLAQLAEQLNIPAHYLSQVINEKLNCTFLEFINSLRVEEAKAKLVDPKLSNYTISAIGYEAGFNAKSTFYAVFKKNTGMTPKQYQKQAIA